MGLAAVPVLTPRQDVITAGSLVTASLQVHNNYQPLGGLGHQNILPLCHNLQGINPNQFSLVKSSLHRTLRIGLYPISSVWQVQSSLLRTLWIGHHPISSVWQAKSLNRITVVQYWVGQIQSTQDTKDRTLPNLFSVVDQIQSTQDTKDRTLPNLFNMVGKVQSAQDTKDRTLPNQ